MDKNSNKKINYSIDSARTPSHSPVFFGSHQRRAWPLINTSEARPILFYKGKKTEKFFTEDSRLYITPKEQKMIEVGIGPDRNIKKWDSLSGRIAKEYQREKARRPDLSLKLVKKDVLWDKFNEYRERIGSGMKEKSKNLANLWSPVQLWNFSIVGAIIIGMISMTIIYKLLGSGASAVSVANKNENSKTEVLGATSEKGDSQDKSSEYIEKIIEDSEAAKKDELEKKIRSMVKGYPIEKMIPYIIEKDQIVAAFLIGIAKKESGWGEHVPVLEGQDCYNYWGYRGKRKLMGTGGHTCFNGPKDAVDTVAKRIEFLVENKKLDTPAKMIIWKCGSACNKDDQAAVRKWISDVNMYFGKLND